MVEKKKTSPTDGKTEGETKAATLDEVGHALGDWTDEESLRNELAASPLSSGMGSHDPTDAISIELRKAREAKALSFSDLHRLTGISRTALHQYESGKTKPGAREILKLCEVLETNPNRLLTGQDHPFSPAGGVLRALVELSNSRPEDAVVLSAMLLPMVAAILSKIGSETLVALATIADETLRARDPETYDHLAKLVVEMGAIDPKGLASMTDDQRSKATEELAERVGPPPGVARDEYLRSVKESAAQVGSMKGKVMPPSG